MCQVLHIVDFFGVSPDGNCAYVHWGSFTSNSKSVRRAIWFTWFSEPHDSVYGTWQSQAVTHPLMNRARRRLTSVIEQISMSERRIPYNDRWQVESHDKWLLVTGGVSWQVEFHDMWLLVTGGVSWQVTARLQGDYDDKWLLVTSGVSWQMDSHDKWLLVTGGCSWQVASSDKSSLMTNGFLWQVATRDRWILMTSGF